MLITRTTSKTMALNSSTGIQDNTKRLAELQQNAINRVKLTAPSSDPAASLQVLSVKADQAAADQYKRNIENAGNWLNMADSAITGSLDMVRRARTLIVQGANGTNGDLSRDAIAVELEGTAAELLKVANTEYAGRNIFAGSSSNSHAYDPVTGVFQGATGTQVDRRIGDDFTVRVDVEGTEVFGDGATSVFQLLKDIAQELRDGTFTIDRLAELDARSEAMTSALADVGARATTVERALERNDKRKVELETNRSSLEDIELTDAITALEFQNTYYQAALGATSKVLKTSLMDYLR